MISMSSVLLRAVVTLPAVPGTYLSQHGKGGKGQEEWRPYMHE